MTLFDSFYIQVLTVRLTQKGNSGLKRVPQRETSIVSASRPPPRPLDAQRFFGGAVLGCFLVLLLSRCFLSLSWVLSGTPSNSLGVFGTSLGSLLGHSRGSWGLSWAFLALLGLSWAAPLAYLGLFWTRLGCSWASLFDPLGPRGYEAATKCPTTAPTVTPEIPKGSNTDPQTPLQDSLSEGVLDS